MNKQQHKQKQKQHFGMIMKDNNTTLYQIIIKILKILTEIFASIRSLFKV